jgi:CRISPR-associated protein Cas2
MIILTLTDCPPSLRGDLSKWLVEISTGVYVGRVSARVRESLWERVKEYAKTGRATLVYPAKNEQRMVLYLSSEN